jgi:hypothetical protein
MSEFVDRTLMRLSDPEELVQLLTPTGDVEHTRLKALLTTAYDFSFATIHDIRDVQVRSVEFQQSLFLPRRTSGTWTQTIPGYTRTDISYERSEGVPFWLDIHAQLRLKLLLEVDEGAIESIITRSIDNFKTLDEFKAFFRFIDLDAFLADHGITTVEELKEAGHYLLTEFHLQPLKPFDPDDAANLYDYTLNLFILIRDTIDVTSALRDAKLARMVIERSLVHHQHVGVAEVRTPCVPVLIFPQAALTGLPFTADVLQAFLAREGILALFIVLP